MNEDAMAEAMDTLVEARGWRECAVCGDEWPLTEEECPGCGSTLTTACSLCLRKIPETYYPALCRSCEGTCRAHARLERTRLEDIREGWTDERGRAR